MARRYISNKNETVRMFESDFLEFFSHVHPLTPVILYVPVMAYMFYLSFASYSQSIGTVVGMFVLGTIQWTFLE